MNFLQFGIRHSVSLRHWLSAIARRTDRRLYAMRLEDRRLPDAGFGLVAGVLTLDGFDAGDVLHVSSDPSNGSFLFSLESGVWEDSNSRLFDVSPDGKSLTVSGFGSVTGSGIGRLTEIVIDGRTGPLGQVLDGPSGLTVSRLSVFGAESVEFDSALTDVNVLNAEVGELSFQDKDDLTPGRILVTGDSHLQAGTHLLSRASSIVSIGGHAVFQGSSVQVGTATNAVFESATLQWIAADDVTIESDSGITLAETSEGDNVELRSAGSVSSVPGTTVPSIIAGTLRIEAGSQIGSSEQPFRFDAETLVTTSGTAGVAADQFLVAFDEVSVESISARNGTVELHGGHFLFDDGNSGSTLAAADEIIVHTDAILSGTGNLDSALRVEDSGVLSPGPGAGTLSVGDLALYEDSRFDAELLPVLPGSAGSPVSVHGTVLLDGELHLTLDPAFIPVVNSSFILIENDGSDPIQGNFRGLSEGASLSLNGQLFVLTYQGGDGNDLAVSAGIPVYQFSGSVYQVIEGNAGTISHPVTVYRSGNIQAATSVELVISGFPGDTTSTADFVAERIQLSFAAGQTSAETSVQIIGDRITERDESLILTMESFSSGGEASSVNGKAEFVILNDDRSSLSILSGIADEGDGATTPFRIDVTLTAAVQGGLSVAYKTVDGSATSVPGIFQDFEAVSGVLTFRGTAGETQTVTVNVTADTWFEASEEFTFVLSDLSAGDPLLDGESLISNVNDAASSTIVNDDTEILVRSSGGDLVISDEVQGGAGHQIALFIDASSSELVVSSQSAGLGTGSAVAVSTLRIPLATVTGQVIVKMQDGDDIVAFSGDGLQSLEFLSDTVRSDHGTVVIEGSVSGQTSVRSLSFQLLGVDTVAVSSFSAVEVLMANGNDVIRIDDGMDLFDPANGAALELGAASVGVELPNLSVRDVNLLRISTAGVDGNDQISIVSAQSAHQIDSLELIAGLGGDVIEVQGHILLTGSLRIQSQQVNILADQVTTGGMQQFDGLVTLQNDVHLSSTLNGVSPGATIFLEEIDADQNTLVIDAGIGDVLLANSQNLLSQISAYGGFVHIRNAVDLEVQEIISHGPIELVTAGSVVDRNGSSTNFYSATGTVSITAGDSVGITGDDVLRGTPVDFIEIDADSLALTVGNDSAVQLLRSTELTTLRGDSLYFESRFEVDLSTALPEVRNLAITTASAISLPLQTFVSGDLRLVAGDLKGITSSDISISAQRAILISDQAETIVFHALGRLAGAASGISGPDSGQIDVAVQGDLQLTLTSDTEVADLNCDGAGVSNGNARLVLNSDFKVTQQVVSALEDSRILANELLTAGAGQFELVNANNDIDRLAGRGPQRLLWTDTDGLEIGSIAGISGVEVRSEFVVDAAGDVLITASIIAGDGIEDTDSTSGERIQIGSRDGHLIVAGDVGPVIISTDENPARSNAETGDQILLVADSDYTHNDNLADPTEGIVKIRGEVVVKTDGGIARQFGPRPQPGVPSTAFFFFESRPLGVTSDNGPWTWDGYNAYLNAFEVLIGQAGEENLLFTIDWQDPVDERGVALDHATQNHAIRLGIDHPVSSERLQQFLIPAGDQTVQIGHIYTSADFTLFQRIQERTLIPVDFSVGHHPSISLQGVAIQQGGVTEVVEGRDLSSSDNALTGDSRFENGEVVFTIPTVTPAPAALFLTGAVPRNDQATVSPPPENSAVPDRPVVDEFSGGSAVESVFATEVYFQIRRQFQVEGPSEIVIEKIVDRRLIGSREALERFVRSRAELQDGAGYEIWLVTETGGQRVERPIVEFEITGGRPGPAFEADENTGEAPQLLEVPFEQAEPEQAEPEQADPEPGKPMEPDNDADVTSATSLNGPTNSDHMQRPMEADARTWTRTDRLVRKYFR